MREIVALAIIIGAALAGQDHVTRIVGGSSASIQQYPFMASMNYGPWGILHVQYCGGALITTTAILSAAHCYHGDSVNQWVARLGSSMASSGGTTHRVNRIINHEHFVPLTLANDVAVIRLTNPAELSDNIRLARIAGTTYDVPDGTAVDVAGWGRVTFGGQHSEQLQHVEVETISLSECTTRYNTLQTIPGFQNWPDVTPDMMCTGILDVGGKDACQGDAGGPVLHGGDIVIGVTSWGYRCGDPFYPRVNTRVSSYTNWIFQSSIV